MTVLNQLVFLCRKLQFTSSCKYAHPACILSLAVHCTIRAESMELNTRLQTRLVICLHFKPGARLPTQNGLTNFVIDEDYSTERHRHQPPRPSETQSKTYQWMFLTILTKFTVSPWTVQPVCWSQNSLDGRFSLSSHCYLAKRSENFCNSTEILCSFWIIWS